MPKKHKEGRYDYRVEAIEKIRCLSCGEIVNYGGTYRDGELVIGLMDLAGCFECGAQYHVLWTGGKAIVYSRGADDWLWRAGHREETWP